MKEPKHKTSRVERPVAAGRTLLDKAQFDAAFARWRDAIFPLLGSAKEGSPWAIIGIKRRGAILARRLWHDLGGKEVRGAPLGRGPLLYGEVDISLYRDDYHLKRDKPMVLGTEITFGVDGIDVLLVDDVLYTGRTVRAAMNLILDFGRPRRIVLAAFVDRGHRELPIAADLVGARIETPRDGKVLVQLREFGETDGVELVTADR